MATRCKLFIRSPYAVNTPIKRVRIRKRFALSRGRIDISSQKSNRKELPAYTSTDKYKPDALIISKHSKLRVLTRQRQNVKSVGKYNRDNNQSFLLASKFVELDNEVQSKKIDKMDIKLLNRICNFPNKIKPFKLPSLSSTAKYRNVLTSVAQSENKAVTIKEQAESSFCNSRSNLEEIKEDPKKKDKMKLYTLIVNDVKPLFFFNAKSKNEGEESEFNTPNFYDSFRAAEESNAHLKSEPKDKILMNRTDLLNGSIGLYE